MSQREFRLADFPDRQPIFGAEGGVVYALRPEQRRTVARCVLFLHSSEPYEWLERTKWDEVRALLLLQAWHRGGDTRVWPFVSAEQLAQLTARPAFGRPRDRVV